MWRFFCRISNLLSVQTHTACDIVEPLISFNRERYSSLGVDFRVLDIVGDELPQGDIAFVRQVLQHLSNRQIQNVTNQLAKKYKYLVVTEHVSQAESFTHNIHQPAGPENRVQIKSGIVLTSAPFNLKILQEKLLYEVPESGGVIRTIFYQLG
jgi:hypothetical protein